MQIRLNLVKVFVSVSLLVFAGCLEEDPGSTDPDLQQTYDAGAQLDGGASTPDAGGPDQKPDAGSPSCEGRCAAQFDSAKPCQCNAACVSHGDCCSDYLELCTPWSLEDTNARCHDGVDNDRSGGTDCEDDMCRGHCGEDVLEEDYPYCSDGVDNDAAQDLDPGYMDCDDAGCSVYEAFPCKTGNGGWLDTYGCHGLGPNETICVTAENGHMVLHSCLDGALYGIDCTSQGTDCGFDPSIDGDNCIVY